MKISAAQYVVLGNGNSHIQATIDGEELAVPINAEGNRHWEAIQAWVAEGNTIQEAD